MAAPKNANSPKSSDSRNLHLAKISDATVIMMMAVCILMYVHVCNSMVIHIRMYCILMCLCRKHQEEIMMKSLQLVSRCVHKTT